MDIQQPYYGGSQATNGTTTGRCDIAELHLQQSGGTAPSFLRNTHDMITFCDRSKRFIACWGNNGMHVMIHDKDALTNEIFPGYFKHSNFKSFARQLNFYGFRKIKSKNKDCCIYSHDYFQYNRADLLPHIQRQTNENHQENRAIIEMQKFPAVVTNSNDVNELKDRVNTLTSTVTSLQQEITDLKSLVARLASTIQKYDDLVSHPQTVQAIVPTLTGDVTASLHTLHNSIRNESNDETLKPQARQTSSPNHGSISKMNLHHDDEAPITYAGILSHDRNVESHDAKRQRISCLESLVYASGVTQHQFALPPPMIMPGGTAHHSFEGKHDHWSIHTSNDYMECHHPMNNNLPTHSISCNQDDTMIDQGTNKTSSLHNNVGECSADNDLAFEDLAWFALFEEDISHKPDDPTTAPQA